MERTLVQPDLEQREPAGELGRGGERPVQHLHVPREQRVLEVQGVVARRGRARDVARRICTVEQHQIHDKNTT